MSHPTFPQALEALERIGRTRLAHVPTPLLRAPSLRAHLAADPELFVKADDWTGFGLGGNKVRKLEYELDPARLQGVTDLITAGGPHSNHCRVTAAAAASLGLGCTLVIDGRPEDPSRGNARLHRMLGARILSVADRPAREEAMEGEARRIEAEGGRALIVPLGASTPRGSLGYVHALLEIRRQLGEEREDGPSQGPDGDPGTWIFTASSSGGTLAGLILGCAILGWRPQLVGVSADEPAHRIKSVAAHLAEHASELVSRGTDLPERVDEVAESVLATDAFIGDGYGISSPESEEATTMWAAHAGVVLDPVYTAKAAAAMTGWLREGRLAGARNVVFVHTGGHPALFR